MSDPKIEPRDLSESAYAAGYRAGQERMRVLGRQSICEFAKGCFEGSIPTNTVLGILSAQQIEDPPQERTFSDCGVCDGSGK